MNQIEGLENLNNFHRDIFLRFNKRLRKDAKEIIIEEMDRVVVFNPKLGFFGRKGNKRKCFQKKLN